MRNDISHEIFRKIINFSTNIPDISKLNKLLQYFLDQVCNIVVCDAGTIYISKDDNLHFKITKNVTLENKLGYNEFHNKIESFLIPINNNSMAGFCANSGENIIINDINLIDKEYPFHFNSSFDKKFNYKTEKVIAVPLKNRNKKVIGVLQLLNPKNDSGKIINFENELLEILHTVSTIISINLENSLLHSKLMDSYLESLYKLGSAAEIKDTETSNHIVRVGEYSALLAKKLGMDEEDVEYIRLTAPMHDIGKIGVSDTILRKPGRFTPDERMVMETHSAMGGDLFKKGDNKIDYFCQIIALCHHEKWDGTGYPLNLKGKGIPILGRIVAIADVFDALMNKRVYKPAWTLEDTVKLIKEESGSQFDPDIVDIFLNSIDEFKEIFEQYRDDKVNIERNEYELKEHKLNDTNLVINYQQYKKDYLEKLIIENPYSDISKSN